MITKIISGGQTGADMGGLKAARILKLATGGTVPNGCVTEDGLNSKLVTKYGCREYLVPGYPGRTIANVCGSDGTVIFASDWNSPGTVCTLTAASSQNKPVFRVDLGVGQPILTLFCLWVAKNNIHTLNVAGHRESKHPGIERLVTMFLVKALKKRKGK